MSKADSQKMSRDDLMVIAYGIALAALGLNGVFDDDISDAIRTASSTSLADYIVKNS